MKFQYTRSRNLARNRKNHRKFKKIENEFLIKNTNRAVGTRISYYYIKNMVTKN